VTDPYNGAVCPHCGEPVEWLGGHPVADDRVLSTHICSDPNCQTTMITVIADV